MVFPVDNRSSQILPTIPNFYSERSPGSVGGPYAIGVPPSTGAMGFALVHKEGARPSTPRVPLGPRNVGVTSAAFRAAKAIGDGFRRRVALNHKNRIPGVEPSTMAAGLAVREKAQFAALRQLDVV
jgi:hypothetical protein